MRDVLDWMLGLRALRFGDEGVRFAFTYELAAWQWALILVGAGMVGWWCYRRIEGARWWRGTLAAGRAGLLVLLAFLAAGPKLTRANETVERDWLLMLTDRSGSLQVADVGGAGGGAPMSRDAQLREMLARHSGGISAAERGRITLWMGFDSGAYELKNVPPSGSATPSASGAPGAQTPPATVNTRPVPDFNEATGRRSDLGAAVEAALSRAAARPVAGIVVMSDGRATDSLSRATLRRLAAERIGIYPIALGSADPLTDLGVRSVQGPGLAFVHDVVPVEAVLERTGSTSREARATVQLVDTLTDKVLDEREVTFDPAPENAPDEARTRRLTLTGTPATAGSAQWRVRLAPHGPDLVTQNNQAEISVDLVDRPLRVLYLDGYPRWEYRYLKNLFARERSMAYASLLLATGRRFLAEGTTESISLPNDAEAWNQYDVIIIGDVRPEVFTPEQLGQIRKRVLIGGAGLLWIAGEGATPGAWRGTTLADLLPITLGGEGSNLRPWDQEVVMKPTPVADRLGVLRLQEKPVDNSWWPAAVSDPASGWSRLRWAQRIERSMLKPAAEVLAEAEGVGPTGDHGALVATMRYGSGRVIYVATDEIWRWRYGRGEDLPERFWLQLVRLLGRESVARSGKPAILALTPGRSEVNAPVRVSVELLDQRLLDAAPGTIAVKIARTGAAEKPGGGGNTTPGGTEGAGASVELVLRPSSEAGSGEGRRVFTGTWIPSQTGLYSATVSDALLAGDKVTAEAEIWLPDDEMKRPEADHVLLANLAKDSGGRMLTPTDLDRLDQIIPRREVRIGGTPDEQALWDTPLALILLLVLATWEWVGRRLIRLA